MLSLKRAVVVLALLAAAVVVAACGGSGSSSSSSGGTSGGTQSTASTGGGSGCGTIPTRMPSDPDGALAKLPQSVQGAYNLYTEPVLASAWASWKPAHPGPYTVYLNAGINNTFAQEIVGELKKLQGSSPLVKSLVIQDNSNAAQTQIQQLQQVINGRKADLIVTFLLSPAADAPVLDAAGKAGIPVVVPLAASTSRYVVGIDGNNALKGAALAQGLMSILGGKGQLLEMQGVPGTQANDVVYQGVGAVLKGCSGAKVAGQPVGNFDPSAAKTQTLQFLSAHPQQVDGAFQVGGMAGAMIQAFQQTGRKVPPVADLGATPAALAYWNSHRSSYKGVAVALPTVPLADVTWNVAAGLLAGRGLKVNEVLQKPLMVTDANLSQWVQPGWTLTTPLGYAPGPPGVYYPPAYLDNLFGTSGK